jgi:hypothetical protein
MFAVFGVIFTIFGAVFWGAQAADTGADLADAPKVASNSGPQDVAVIQIDYNGDPYKNPILSQFSRNSGQ